MVLYGQMQYFLVHSKKDKKRGKILHETNAFNIEINLFKELLMNARQALVVPGAVFGNHWLK